MKRAAAVLVLALSLCGCSSSTADRPTPENDNKASQGDALYSLTLMRQGSVLLQQQQYKDALKKFHEADRVAPGNATVYNMIGICNMRMEQYEDALAAFDRALRQVPSFTDARNNRGATYLALGQYRMAEVDFLAVLADTTYPHRWEAYYNLGLTYLQRGELGAAEENFHRAATGPKPIFAAFLRLEEIALEQGKQDEAVDILEDARVRFPERVELALRLGRLLIQQGRSDEATRYLQEVIDARPDSDMAREAEALLAESR